MARVCTLCVHPTHSRMYLDGSPHQRVYTFGQSAVLSGPQSRACHEIWCTDILRAPQNQRLWCCRVQRMPQISNSRRTRSELTASRGWQRFICFASLPAQRCAGYRPKHQLQASAKRLCNLHNAFRVAAIDGGKPDPALCSLAHNSLPGRRLT